MNTSRWRVPGVFAKAVAWFVRKVDDASAVPVQYEVAKRAERRAQILAPAAHLDAAARLVRHVEARRAEGQPDEDTRTELHAALTDLGLTPGAKPAVESEPIREELQVAFARTRHGVLELDFYRAAYPFWRFNAVLDDRTTQGCRALNGLTMPAKDERWAGFVPPRHWRCRSHLDAVVHSEGVNAPKRKPIAEYAGEGTFATLNEEWEPRPGNYPPDLWDIYAAAKDIESPHIELAGPWWRKNYKPEE
jgi:SPP1 gp7 family putative phage head morphogenesis protein